MIYTVLFCTVLYCTVIYLLHCLFSIFTLNIESTKTFHPKDDQNLLDERPIAFGFYWPSAVAVEDGDNRAAERYSKRVAEQNIKNRNTPSVDPRRAATPSPF